MGLELTRKLIAKGAAVIAVGRDEERLAALAAEHGPRVVTTVADLGEPGEPRALARWVAAEHPACSVLVNNAAIMVHTDLTETPEGHLDDIEREIAVNLTAPLQLAVAMLPVLAAKDRAAIVNVTSGLAVAPKRAAAVYCATKAGLRSFTRSLRDQVRAAGLPIQVTEGVMPLVDTTLSRPGPIRRYPPDRAAADLLAGVERGEEEVWIEKARLLRVVHRVAPTLAYRAMRAR